MWRMHSGNDSRASWSTMAGVTCPLRARVPLYWLAVPCLLMCVRRGAMRASFKARGRILYAMSRPSLRFARKRSTMMDTIWSRGTYANPSRSSVRREATSCMASSNGILKKADCSCVRGATMALTALSSGSTSLSSSRSTSWYSSRSRSINTCTPRTPSRSKRIRNSCDSSDRNQRRSSSVREKARRRMKCDAQSRRTSSSERSGRCSSSTPMM
mmetsp:Transcript_27190/g.87405  ORF Transcript_27190/g.87405 Transcript_27190/m.87405 type:complete len:214 (+) Transcript_27190:55-696(+)